MAAVLALVLVVSVFATRPFFKTGTGDGTTDAPDTFVVPSAEELGYKPVVISADIFKQNWQPGDGARVNTEGDATAFQVGDQIYIENLNQAMANHPNRSAVYTFDGIRWKPEDGHWLAWDESNGPTTRNDFIAYTPVTTGTTHFDFALPADQSTIEKLRSADFMTAVAIETSETDKQVELKFSHMLAKITVTIFGDEGTIDNVRIISPLSGVGEGATDLNAEITPYAQYDSENGCYRYIAVIAPGTYNDDELLRYAKDGVTISVQIPSTLTDKKINYGKHYQLTIHEDMAIGTVTVMDWNDAGTIDAGTATESQASYSVSGSTAVITVPEYASAASVQAAITAVAADASVTTITVNGTLSDTQQTTLATALEGNTTLEIVFEDMNIADLSDDVKWMGNPIDTADGAILQVGSCGDNAQYMIYHTGNDNSRTVSIKGTGAMADYDGNNYAPWCDEYGYIPNITRVEIAEGITTVGINAFFDGFDINSVSLPESIEEIKWQAFASTGLTEVIIPEKVNTIATRAFGGCSSLASVTVLATTPPTLGENVFNNCSENLVIYVPAEFVEEYTSKWSDYSEKIQPIQ